MDDILNPARSSDQRQEMLAFLSDAASEAVMRSLATTLGLPSTCVMMGGIKAAVKYLKEKRSPKVLFIDLAESELPISDVNELSEVCEPGVVVIALGTRNDVGLFRELLSLGVSDYLVKPVSIDLVRRTISNSQGVAEQEGHGIRAGRLVSVLGVRGGLGATTVAANAAWILANERSKRIALLDLDMHFGNMNLFLDLKPSIGFRQAMEMPERIDGTFIERVMVKHSERLAVLGGEEELDKPIQFSEKSLETLLPILRNQFHYVLFDLPRAITTSTLHLLRKSSLIVLVCDLTIISVRELNRLIASLQSDATSQQRLIIVANKVGMSREEEIPQAEFEKAINRSVNHLIQFQPDAALQAMNGGQPVVRSANLLTQGLRRLVDDLGGGMQLLETEPSLLDKILEKVKFFG